jgi:hypothetical protein
MYGPSSRNITTLAKALLKEDSIIHLALCQETGDRLEKHSIHSTPSP